MEDTGRLSKDAEMSRLDVVKEDIIWAIEEIRQHFVHPCSISFVVRNKVISDADMLITDDSKDDLIETINRLWEE